MRIKNIKSPELADLNKDKHLIIIPIGAIEAHGPHLPLGTDSIIAKHFAKKICEKFSKCILAPTLSYTFNLINYDYLGTISVQPENFAHYLQDVIKSFYHHGFKNFFLLSSHGGNDVPVKLAIFNLLKEIPNIKIAFKTWWKLARVRSRHAEKLETELMMMIKPELVDLEKAIDCKSENPWHYFSSRKKFYPETFGVNGEPTKANLDSAGKLYENVCESLFQYIELILNKLD